MREVRYFIYHIDYILMISFAYVVQDNLSWNLFPVN